MTALLTADEAARLRPGEQLVIVRAGWVTDGAVTLRLWQGDTLHPPWRVVAPQDWVALTGPCPTCGGVGHRALFESIVNVRGGIEGRTAPCRDCRDGRRIVPLPSRCPIRTRPYEPCPRCANPDVSGLLVGRGSIEVVPVTDAYHKAPDVQPTGVMIELGGETLHWMPADFPLPVPGRDWGIVIDCVEVAP